MVGVMKLIGENLFKLRKRLGLTQGDLGHTVGIRRETINRIERNKMNPTIELVYQICRRLGVPVKELITEPEELV